MDARKVRRAVSRTWVYASRRSPPQFEVVPRAVMQATWGTSSDLFILTSSAAASPFRCCNGRLRSRDSTG